MSGHNMIASLVTLTAASSYINHKFIRLPQAIGLTLITFLLSVLLLVFAHFGLNMAEQVKAVVVNFEFNDAFLHGMLGFLLFAVSMHVDFHELAHQKWVILLLTTLSVMISTVIVGGATWAITHFLGLHVSLGYCFVFGALISPTDPIAVLAILKSLKVPKSLEVNFAGEALFNDGMAIVLFVVILGIATGHQNDWPGLHIFSYFLQQGVGGILFGALLGFLASYLLRGVDSYELAVLITLAVVSGGYALADTVLNVSGVISIVVAGLIVGGSCHHLKMNQQTVDKLDTFWVFIDDVLNAFLFVIIGLEFIQLSFIKATWILAISAVAIVITARWISVFIPMIVLLKYRKPKIFNLNIVHLMTWGGIRGGIAIALALTIPQSAERDLIVTLTYAVVIFSIVVQGLTIEPLVRKLVDFPVMTKGITKK